MEVKLNRQFLLLFLILTYCFVSSQSITKINNYSDYKSGQQFKNFRKRRKIIGAWQINQLKNELLEEEGVTIPTEDVVEEEEEEEGEEEEF